MAALVIVEGQGAAVSTPLKSGQVQGIGEEIIGQVNLAGRVDVENYRLFQVNDVTWFRVEHG